MGIWISTRPAVHAPGIIDASTQEAHITLAYLDSKSYKDEEFIWHTIHADLESFVKPRRIAARINGIATWIAGPPHSERYYLVASVASNNSLLHRWQAEIVQGLVEHTGLAVDTSYPFVPHITLARAFTPHVEVPELVDPIPFKIDNLYVSRGSSHHERVW